MEHEMFEPGETETKTSSVSKVSVYEKLMVRLRDLLDDDRDFIANAANTAALIYDDLPELNWAGFYILRGNRLVVGPFQGKPACTHIAIGRGVCGKAAETCKTIVVEDVHRFPGHIACDNASMSEIVVPLVHNGSLLGVLDLDSPLRGRFDAQDRAGLEDLVKVFLELTEIDV